jgi:predicted ATPase/class 3 adenylate cyclase
MDTPSGAVTFLFTDVEGSTRLWAEHTDAMNRAMQAHDVVLRAAIAEHHGYVFSTGGDGFGVAFAAAADAVAAAVAGQVGLARTSWDGLPADLRVRMGLHTGVANERGGDYFGPEVNLAARVMAAAWGGQIVCSAIVAERAGVLTQSLGEHRLRDVPGVTSLHQVVADGMPVDFPALRTLDVAPSTLPAQRSGFVGRHADIEAVRRLLLDRRSITLTGPGGTGKTRLAVEIAGREAPRRPGGTFFADLSSVDDGAYVPATVARACLAPPDSGLAPIEQLVDTLADRDALVVIDNCEHVLDASSELVGRLLDDCPGVAVLATSREALDLPGEHQHLVGPLDLAGEAEDLFVERALAIGGRVTDPSGTVVRELCARLDGIPLAIELAAARTRTLTPSEILDHLDSRFEVLATRRRGLPDRHQTLRATIDWSYQLLDDGERDLFDHLAVFTGGFDLDAAAALMSRAPLGLADVMDGLVAKSMVTVQDDAEGRLRFRLLDSLRAFASERLAARPDVWTAAADTHAEYFLSRLASTPTSRVMARALHDEFEPDIDNLRSAFDHVVEGPGRVELAQQAATPFVCLLVNSGLIGEARVRVERVLDGVGVPRFERGRLLATRAYMDATEDGSSAFAQFAVEALQYLSPGDGAWSAAFGLTSIPMQMFAPADALLNLDRARAQLDSLHGADPDHDRAMLDFYIGGTLMNLRRYADAVATFKRSAGVLASLEPTSIVRLWSACGAAIGQTLLGRPRDALATLDEVDSLVDWTDWAVEWAFARSLALAHCGPTDEARRPLVALAERLGGDRASPLVPTVVIGFGLLAAMEDRTERAAELLEVLTAARSAAATAAAYEVLGRIEGWNDEEFSNRKLTRAIEAGARQSQIDRRDYFAKLHTLAREEVANTRT